MKPGYLLYKCRICGEIFDGPHCPDARLAARSLDHGDASLSSPSWHGTMRFSKTVTHECTPYTVGIADFVGSRDDYAAPDAPE